MQGFFTRNVVFPALCACYYATATAQPMPLPESGCLPATSGATDTTGTSNSLNCPFAERSSHPRRWRC